jgi:cytochrome c peroxidase
LSTTRSSLLFRNKAKCANCHASSLFADNILHTAGELGIDDFEAMRSPAGKFPTTPLGGLFPRSKGGFNHDDRFATLGAFVNHYNNHFSLMLSHTEKQQLVEYLIVIAFF